MNLQELFEKGYEIMGTVCFPDEAVAMTNDFKGYYRDVHWVRYKRTPGEEDAYAILCKNPKHIITDDQVLEI